MAPAEAKGGVRKSGAAKSSRVGKRQGDGKKGLAKDADGLDFGPPLQARGLFANTKNVDVCPLRTMMYGYGDAEPQQIYSDTVELIEDIAIDYCSNIMRKAVDQSNQRGLKNIQPEDILFILRKDDRKFKRCKELLTMNEEIKQARKQFEEDDKASQQALL